MKFILLFYTDGWEAGPSVELSHVPAPGSVVWTAGRRRGEDGEMYYVDNVMYPECGMEKDDSIYLYVRPYNGYARYAPMTEADRIAEKLTRITDAVDRMAAVLERLNENTVAMVEGVAALRKETVLVKEGIGEEKREFTGAAGRLIGFADAIEDGQQVQSEKLDDIIAVLEELKERF